MAMKAESEPLIEHFRLVRDHSIKFPYFINKDLEIVLIGTGIGKKNIRPRINHLSKIFESQTVQYINIGTAGGVEKNTIIGQIYLINNIIDENSGSKFYPDILVKHNLDEGSIVTVDNAITSGKNNYQCLVDMESSEIFKVCTKKTFLHNLAFLKVVSDHMDSSTSSLDYDTVYNLISSKINQIDTFIDQFMEVRKLNIPILNNYDLDWINSVKKTLSITQTQKYQLTLKVKKYKLKYPEMPIPDFKIHTPKSKEERNKTFLRICGKLAA